MYSLIMIVVFFALVLIGVIAAVAVVVYMNYRKKVQKNTQPENQIDAKFKE